MQLLKEFTFEAAHRLPKVAADHKCARLHGHSFRVVVHIEGPVNEDSGMVVDFADITAAVKPVIDGQLDHYYLNDVPGLENPTSENLARWLWQKLRQRLPLLSAIEVRETCTSGCIYDGDDTEARKASTD